MGNRFTRAAETKEIDIEKQQTQQPLEEAEEVKIMVYSPQGTGMEEGNLKPIKWAPISPLNGIEVEKNGRNGSTPAKKIMMEQTSAKQNGHFAAAGSSKMLKKNEQKKANGHLPGPLTANGTNGNANGILARPQRRRAAKAAAANRQKEANAAGVGRGRPGTKLTGRQIRMLENSYKTTQYLALPSRIKLAAELGMTEKKVKQWYANRRRQSKKQMKAIRAANEKHAAWQMEEDEAEEEEEMDEEFEEA